MPPIANVDEGFKRTMDALRLMLGLSQEPDAGFMMNYCSLGFHGYSINVFQSHIDYLNAINSVIRPDLPVFDLDTIERWKIINELLLASLINPDLPGTNSHNRHFPSLAALVAFPTLEEIARLISKRWSEDGKLFADAPLSDRIGTWHPDGSVKLRAYHKGEQIVDLSHKLQLMHLSLDPKLQITFSDIDAELRRPMADGMTQPMSPLYARLKFFRDRWVHGRRYEGWEALLISLLLALVYFDSLRLRERAETKPSVV